MPLSTAWLRAHDPERRGRSRRRGWPRNRVGVCLRNGLSGGIGVYAAAPNTSTLALRVDGKVRFSRSGRLNMSTGATRVTVNLAGVTSRSKVFAVLASSESGRYVRAVVPATGKFTAHLNRSLSSSAKLAWFVLD